MIELADVSMRYPMAGGEVTVLDRLSLEVAAGERIAITGPSGSGKTTLLLVLTGLETPSAGRVVIDGAALETLDDDARADLRRDRLGIVFQSFHLVPALSAVQNVALPLDIAGHRDAAPRAVDMLAAVGLADRASHYPSQLSGGEQQRVAIARAMVHGPSLLVADEPTGNLDTATGESIVQLLFELEERSGTTLLLVTHDVALAARCDRTLVLGNGRLTEAAA